MEDKIINKLKITVGILTWGSQRTLRNTLDSYKKNGLLDIVDEVILFAQEFSIRDSVIASQYEIKFTGSPNNIGIGKAFTELFNKASNDIVLILENDWVLVENKEKTYSQLEDGIHLLNSNKADFVKYRHRISYGHPLYTLQFKDREMDSPPHLFDCVHYREHPDLDFPDKIKKIQALNSEWYICDSKYANHTNNPFMCTRSFYLNNISKFSGEGVDLEGFIFNWWQEQGFTITHSDGLFKHERIDR